MAVPMMCRLAPSRLIVASELCINLCHLAIALTIVGSQYLYLHIAPPLFVRVDSQCRAGSSREFYKRHEGEFLVYNILVAGRNLSGMRASLSFLFASGMTCCSGCCCFGICSCA